MVEVDCVVCSPPYTKEALGHPRGQSSLASGFKQGSTAGQDWSERYGEARGQLGSMRVGEAMEAAMRTDVETMDWPMHLCYGDGWSDQELVPEAFAHPAKAAKGLLRLIFDDLFRRGELRRGDLVLDPFLGVATSAIEAASRGCRFVGCELEEKFHSLCLANIELHRRTWLAAGDPLPVCLLGDSRNLAALVGPALAEAVVASPPYSGNSEKSDRTQERRDERREEYHGQGKGCFRTGECYGRTEGQLGNLPPGTPPGDCAVSSPPYEGILHDDGKTLIEKPPRPGDVRQYSRKPCQTDYGDTPGNVGNTSGTTFWNAARQIVRQTRLCLRDGAMTAWIVKRYCKRGAIVPFPDQWATLLESEGLQVVRRARAWLVQETVEPDLFGGDPVKRKSRCSFFRRLYEKKHPENKIEWEDVIFARKV